ATREELAARQARTPLAELRARAVDAPAPRDFAAALRPAHAGPARLIGEVKRASPSKGLLVERFDPVALARAYAAGGAAAISVLTEPDFFHGALDHLRAVRAAVDVPVLRKDFLLDPYQVYEARAAGADAVLLICALLDDAALRDLLALARSLGMEALVEAHNADEARRAVDAGATVIGVNSRDLRTFAVDSDVVRRLRPLVPADRIFVAESGIADERDAARARAFGADAILVGEALMRASAPAELARRLSSAPGGAPARFFAEMAHPYVKICGLRTEDDVRAALHAGADAFGLIFAPSRRQVTPDHARQLVAAARAHSRQSAQADFVPNPRPSHLTLDHGSPSPTRGGGQGERVARTRDPLAIGVFVNESVERIAEIAAFVGLDAVQLSGDESPGICAAVAVATGLPVLRALRLRTADDLPQLDAYALAGATLMLDTPSNDGSYGGTGQPGDWQLAAEAARRWPIILAGGLTPDNLAEALAVATPRGVDVSSGVETNGVKDAAKIAAFLQEARTFTPPRAGEGPGERS
ncbi:MAG TPA: indole-3-glycerol phosphate synthase TrpC, partial [Ktedonobacterales bacterium]|nr:indole-3-glycerol phosphate synthase TrpC [Ktedonobacterales bacterium]